MRHAGFLVLVILDFNGTIKNVLDVMSVSSVTMVIVKIARTIPIVSISNALKHMQFFSRVEKSL